MKGALVFMCMVVSMMPDVFAVSVGSNISAYVGVENFIPRVWLCDDRIAYDDATEPGRISYANQELTERTQNYAFEGEKVAWDILVMDKNGIQKLKDVYVIARNLEAGFEAIEANCIENLGETRPDFKSCNARILEKELGEFNEGTMQFYVCTFNVETPLHMYGEHAVTIEAEDLDGQLGRMDETEYWFLNPEVSLSITGVASFKNARPGTQSYSDIVAIGNEADYESGVQLDMFISGTDFYDLEGRRGVCPDTNQLKLGDGESDCDSDDPFCYFATHNSYDTTGDLRSSPEGYVGINYGIGFNDPNPFYGGFNGDVQGYEIMQTPDLVGPYFPGNVLTPKSEMALTFRLNLPEPCNGDFNSGSIFFWGEVI